MALLRILSFVAVQKWFSFMLSSLRGGDLACLLRWQTCFYKAFMVYLSVSAGELAFCDVRKAFYVVI